MLIIGIDPAFRKNGFGFCCIDTKEKTAYFKVFKDFLAFLSWFNHERPQNAVYCVENSNKQKINFTPTGNKNQLWGKGRSVGKNQAISQATSDVIRSAGCQLFDISPKQKGAKWSEKTAKAVFLGLKLKANIVNWHEVEDLRDALKLAEYARQRVKLI